MSQFIEFDDFSLEIGGEPILRNLSFRLEGSVFFAVSGPSGSGKSTLLNQIALADDLPGAKMSGSKAFSYTKKDCCLHYVTVDDNVFSSLTPEDNLRLFCSDKKRIAAMLESLNLSDVRGKRCSLLSKGERERVAIAAGLLDSKPILLLDEPTANLDEKNSDLVFEMLAEFSVTKTVIIATHDVGRAQRYADAVTVLDSGSIKSNQSFKQAKNTAGIHKNKSDRTPFATYAKLGFKSLFSFKAGLAICTVLSSVLFLLVFTIVAYANVDYLASYSAAIKEGFSTSFITVEDSRYDSWNMGYNDYLGVLKAEGGDGVESRVKPLFYIKNMDPQEEDKPYTDYISTAYSSSFASVELEGKIQEFYLSSGYSKEENYYPIFLTERGIATLAKSGTKYEPGDAVRFRYADTADIKFIYGGEAGLPGVDFVEALVPEDIRFARYDKSITFEDFQSSLEYYDLQEYVNGWEDTRLVSLISSMNLGNRIMPYDPKIPLTDDSNPIVGDDEIIVTNSIFYNLLFHPADYPSVAEFSAPFRERIDFKEVSYYLSGILDHVKVVGCTEEYPAQSTVYVSPAIYRQICEKVTGSNYDRYSLAMEKKYVLDNADQISSKVFTVDQIIDYPSFCEENRLQSRAFIIIAIAVAAAVVGTMLIFVNNVNKKNYKNFALLTLVGKKRGERLFVYSSMMGLLFLVPFIITLIFGLPFVTATKLVLSKILNPDPVLITSLRYNPLWSFLATIAVFIGMCALALPSLLALRRKSALRHLGRD